MGAGGDLLRSLLPIGDVVWTRAVPDLVRDQVLDALGLTYDRARSRALDIVEESFPNTAIEMLPEWERALSLPDSCSALSDIVAERQRRAHAKMIRRGGHTIAYLEGVARALGFDITIEEHQAFAAGSACGEALDPDDLVIDGKSMPWCYVLDIRAPAETVFEFDCASGCAGEPLAWWGNEYFECVMRGELRRSLYTRHLYVRFFYGDA